MVRLSGSRILGYESGFDSAGRGLDALAEAGQIQNERQRQGVQDQQTAEAHTQLIQQLALKNKELQDKLDQLPKQHAQEQQVFDAQMQDRQRGIAEHDAQRSAMEGLGQVLSGGQANQRDPNLFYDSAGASKAFGAGDPTTQDQPDAHPDLQNHMEETQNILKGMASVLPNLPPHMQATVLSTLYNQRQQGMAPILGAQATTLIDQMKEAGTLPQQPAANGLSYEENANQIIQSGDPKKIQALYTNLKELHKATREKSEDMALRNSAMTEAENALSLAPSLGVSFDDKEAAAINAWQHDISDPTVSKDKALAARDNIRKAVYGKAANAGSGGKGDWREKAGLSAIESIFKDTLSPDTIEQKMAKAHAIAQGFGLDGGGGGQQQQAAPAQAGAPQPAQQQQPLPREVLSIRYEKKKELGREPTEEELADAYRKADAQSQGQPQQAPQASAQFGGAQQPRVYTEGEARKMHAEDPAARFARVNNGYVITSFGRNEP